MERIVDDFEKMINLKRNATENPIENNTASYSIPQEKTEENCGICSNCINADGCTFNPCLNKTVLNCGEFEQLPPRQRQLSYEQIETELKSIIRRKNSENINAGEYLGICENCANLEQCTFPKPESGVWSCDEYTE
ncbi:MAG: hypothetical protein ACLFQV_09405 [Vulcanimicrobiota bacterium]